nr:unnamed protein product [Callosobruchus chinensis]
MHFCCSDVCQNSTKHKLQTFGYQSP